MDDAQEKLDIALELKEEFLPDVALDGGLEALRELQAACHLARGQHNALLHRRDLGEDPPSDSESATESE